VKNSITRRKKEMNQKTTLLPVYYQIKQTIKNWIVNREFGVGDKIPSENELAERFRVTRLTVRQAITQLVQEGFLTSRRGQGTFVTGNESLLNALSLESTGFIDEIFSQTRKSKTKYAKIYTINPPKFVREKLELDEEEKNVVRIKRVRYLKANPFSYIINYLPISAGSKIEKEELYKKSFLQILEYDLGIQFTEAFQTIEASFANADMATKLKIPSGAPMLFIERIMYTQKKRPIALSQLYYRGDLFKYIIRLKRVKGKTGNQWVHKNL